MHKPRVAAALLLISTFFVGGNTSAQAQDANSAGTPILVSPAVLNSTLNPGESTTQTFQVTNNSANPIQVATSTHSLITTNNDLPPQYRKRLDASTWITVSPSTFALQPSQTLDITAMFTAPNNAEAGGHYASIIVSPQPENAPVAPGTAAKVLGQVDVSTLTTVTGNVHEQLTQVGNLKVKHVNVSKPIVFTFALKNTGNVHMFPSNIELDVTNRSGTIVEQLQVPADKLGAILLPGTTRQYQLVWPEMPSPGWYHAKVIVNYGASSDAKVLTMNSSRFWAASITSIVVSSVILAVVAVFGIRLVLRRRKRHSSSPQVRRKTLHETP